ncbi:MAG: peptidylprolyl isomerase [Kiritimatiellae bacterium]|nr:peptidylprolyl isomerase [Kiritimatiellia bacterium]
MKCTQVILTTLLCALVVTTGCKEKTDEAAPSNDKVEVPQSAVTAPAKPEEPKDPNEVVASINGVKYIRKDMDEVVNAIIKARNVPAEQIAMAREHFEKQAAYSFIMKSLLMAQAEKEGIKLTDELRKEQTDKVEEQLKAQDKTLADYFKESPMGEERARKEFEEGMLIDKLLTDKVIDKIEISDADANKQIEELTAANKELEENNNNLDKINAEKKTKIEDLKKQLADGADFEELAKANSECPSGQQGGSLGEFTRGQMVKPFEDVAFALELNKVSDVVETDFGYHLIKTTAKSAAVEASGDTPAKPESVTASHILIKSEQAQPMQEIPSLEELKKDMKNEKSQAAVQEYIEALKKDAKIETIFKDLPL